MVELYFIQCNNKVYSDFLHINIPMVEVQVDYYSAFKEFCKKVTGI